MKIGNLNIDVEDIFTAKEVYDNILDSIKNKIPFSLLRVGDGETLILCPDKREWADSYKKICINHLGYVLNEIDSVNIKNIIQDSIINSDIIGMAPKRHREINQYWDAQHYLVKELQQKNNINSADIKYCSLDIHMHLLQCGLLDKLLSVLDSVVIISSRDLKEDILKKYSNIKNIEYYLVSPENLYEKDAEKSNLYPSTYEYIIEKLHEKNRSGQVCLYGAGFIGKGFGYHFKKAGGVAVDIGSVFDLWEGKKTRGKGKGKTAVNFEFVLNQDKLKEHTREIQSSRIKGYHVCQHKDFPTVFNPFLKLHKFTHILEIGTYRGGFTMYLRMCNRPTTKILSYDIQEQPEYKTLRLQNIDIKIKNIFDEKYTRVIDEQALSFLSETGSKLILCDGGNKAAEFNCLSKYLNIGDFIMAHDYAFSHEYFKKNIRWNIWNSCEVVEEELLECSVKNKLIHYNYDQFQNIAWVCKTKIR